MNILIEDLQSRRSYNNLNIVSIITDKTGIDILWYANKKGEVATIVLDDRCTIYVNPKQNQTPDKPIDINKSSDKYK